MEKALSTEFRKISFLWSGEQQDPVVTALVDWKDDLLCELLFPFPVVVLICAQEVERFAWTFWLRLSNRLG